MSTSPTLLERFARRMLQGLGYRSRHVATSAGDVHLLSRDGGGELPPVLLIHGFGAAAMQWAPTIRKLRPHVRSVTAIDLPGHGFSFRTSELTLDRVKAGVIEALDHDAGEPRIVVGNSLGGAIALRYAQARPDHVAGVHLLSPGGAPMQPDELDAVKTLFRVVTHREATVFLDKLYARPQGWLGHLMAPFVRRTFRDPALHGLLDRVTDGDWLTPDEVRTVVRPMRVTWGKRDRILPGTGREFFRAHLPDGSTLDEPDDYGHAPQLDSPGWAATEIVAFARRCVDRTAASSA